MRAGVFDHAADPRPLVAGEVVHDDQVAGAQFGNEDLFDLGLEGVAIDRAAQHEGRDHAPSGQPGDEGRGVPAAVVHRHAQARAPRRPAMAGRHVGFVFSRLARSWKLSQPADLGSDDLESAVGLVGTQVRQRDEPRRQVGELQPDGVRRLRHEHRLEIEQAEVLPAGTRSAVIGSDPTKRQFEFDRARGPTDTMPPSANSGTSSRSESGIAPGSCARQFRTPLPWRTCQSPPRPRSPTSRRQRRVLSRHAGRLQEFIGEVA